MTARSGWTDMKSPSPSTQSPNASMYGTGGRHAVRFLQNNSEGEQ